MNRPAIGDTDRADTGSTSCALQVSLHLEENGPQIAREVVTDADLSDAFSETWFDAYLRRGLPRTALEDLSMSAVPTFEANGDHACAGFAIEVAAHDGQPANRKFGIAALEHVAARGARALVRAGRLGGQDLYYFRLYAGPTTPACPGQDQDNQTTLQAQVRHTELRYLVVPHDEIRRESKPFGEQSDDHYPVYYTSEALEKSERFARRGAQFQPPVETGSVLCGILCSCPVTGEMFCVVCDIIELVDADERQRSLSYSAKTWARVQTVLRARQRQPEWSAQRIVGQSHGHSFLPGGDAARCDLCPKLAVCNRTSVFVSADDRRWSRSVFHRQPWQLCHIFGLSARGERVNGLYGLNGGQLMARGFRVIDHFDPTEWAGEFATGVS